MRQPHASGPAVRARDDMFQATDTPWAPSHPSTKPGQVHTSILRPSSAGYCIVLLVLFGNVARGAVRYSRRLRSRPLQPFLSGSLFGFQSHASYLFQKLAIAMDQPCCSTADHASLPQETASKDCATLAWSAMRPSSGWNTGSLTKRVIRRRDQAMGRSYNVIQGNIGKEANADMPILATLRHAAWEARRPQG